MDDFQMNELHGIGIYDITSFSSDKFYEERTSACLDNINYIHAPFPWHLIGFSLVPKCIHSHHTMPMNKILEFMIIDP
jgi:hypothetical protein